MYYKLPIKERMELMKSYRKANPDMSYRDMVNDYNTSYEKFGNGGIKEDNEFDFSKTQQKAGPRVEEDLYSGLYNTVETPKNLSELPSYRAYTYGANQYYAPISHPQKGLEGVLSWDEKTGTNYQLNPANYKPYKEIPMTGDKSDNLRRFVLDVVGEGQQQTADLYRTKSGNVENIPTRVYNTDEIKQNVFKELYAQNLFKFKGDKDAAFGATREFIEKNVEPKYGEYYKFKQDPEHYKVLGQYSDTNLNVLNLISNLADKHIQGKNLNQEELNSIIKGEEFAKSIEEYKPALRDYFKTGKNLSSKDTDELINKSFNEYYQSQQPQKHKYGGIQKFEDGGKKDNTNVVINKGLPIKSLEELKKESDKIIAQKKMLAALKSKDYAKEKTNYEETTRGANQMDGSGISSAELGWRYAKLTDPTFVSGAAEVIKDAYMGNKQNMLNLAGAIPIPYLSGASKFAKNVRKYYYLDKVGDITNKGQDILQEFGNGGKKEKESSKTVVHTDKTLFDKAYKAEKDSLYAYNLTSRDKYADKVNYMRMNLNSPNMSKEDIAGFTNLYKETDDYYKNINEPYRVVTVTKTKNNLKNDTGNLLEQYLKNTKLKPEEYKVIKDKQLYGQTYYSYDPKTLKVTNPVHKYENKITPAKFLAKEFPKITDKDVQNLYNRTLNDGSEPLYYTGKLTPNQEQIKGSRTPKTGYFPAAGVVEKVGTHISVIPYWKKPVIHNIYEPPVEPIQDTIKPVIKDTVKQKPIVDNVDSGLTRRWNFNASNPTLEYYDKSNKLVRSEYYKNMNDFKQGKQIKQ